MVLFILQYIKRLKMIYRTAITFSIVLINLLIMPLVYQKSYSLVVANNPFYSMSDAKIHSVKGKTTDGKHFVVLDYSPDVVKKGELTFFRINFFNSDDKDRTRHVDCDLIISGKGKLFKASEQYGEPLIHSPDGIMLTSFDFNQTGKYMISVEIAGLNFFPIKPLYVDFTASVSVTSEGNSRIVLSA
jgi:hypothetical protein